MSGSDPIDPIEMLERWVGFGGTWKVAARSGAEVTISLCRCDGGEEVDRLSCSDPALVTYLRGRDSSEC